MTTIADEQPRIYVACLTAYNAGWLHGVWIDATDDVDAMQKQIDDMMNKSPFTDSEEWAIHDFECFGGRFINEYDHLEKIADFISLFDKYGKAAVSAYMENHGNFDEAHFNETFVAECDNPRDWLYDQFEELCLAGLDKSAREIAMRYISRQVAIDAVSDYYTVIKSGTSHFIFGEG